MALRDGPALLARDHSRARELAAGLAALSWARVDVAAVETNIVMLDVAGSDRAAVDPDAVIAHLREHAVLAAKAGPLRIRFVLHRDVPDDGVDRCLAACRSFAPRPLRPSRPDS
jgi:threonine aldolase